MRLTNLRFESDSRKLYDKFGDKIIIIQYKKNKLSFKCQICGNLWDNLLYVVLRNKHGCPNCTKKKDNPNLKIVCKEKCKIKVKCDLCKFTWTTIPKILSNANGCPVCQKHRYQTPELKNKTIGSKAFKVRLNEDLVLNYLVANNLYTEELKTFSSNSILEITWTWNNNIQVHYPDIFTDDTIYDFMLVDDLKKYWKYHIAKAKACSKSYKYRLLIITNNTVYRMPLLWYKRKEGYVDSFLRKLKHKTLRILSIDPGSKNMAWSVMEINNTFKIKSLKQGTFQHPINDLKGVIDINNFSSEVKHIIKDNNVEFIGIERFMTRGIKGVVIEYINVMIGTVITIASEQQIETMLITAAEWKNAFNTKLKLDYIYTKFESPHKLDAALIGLYCSYKIFDRKPFFNVKRVLKLIYRYAHGKM